MAPEGFDLRLASPFVVLAEELHFGRAAQRLGTGQPALSQQLARLERQLGVLLVRRGSGQVTLTPAGARFLAEVRAMLDRVELVEAALRGGRGELRLHLGAGMNPVVGEVVGSFVAAHPHTVVHTAEGAPTAAPRAVRAGAADVAFGLASDATTGLGYAPMASGALGVATAVDHPIARRGRARWADLEGEPVIVAPPGVSDASNLLLRTALRLMDVRVREVVSPPVPKAHYLQHQVVTGTALLVAPPWVFVPPPPGIVWIVLEPAQHLELGILWDDRAPAEPVRRFVAWARTRSRLVTTRVGADACEA